MMNVELPERKPNEVYRWEAQIEFFNGIEWVPHHPIYVKASKEEKAKEKTLSYCSTTYKTSRTSFRIKSIKVIGVTNKTN